MSAAHKPIDVRVEITEVDDAKASQLGVEWLDQISYTEGSPSGVVSLGSIDRATPVRADVHLMIEEGAAELLANPNLITDSGTSATFHAGGEIPYVTNTSLGSTHVEFKAYGVMLDVRPVWLDTGLIQMKIRAAVSAPDNSNGVLLSGNRVPALSEREVSSNVTVRPGETITLAGLMQMQKEDITRGVPILRKIPILGALFRWKTQRTRRTTIIMFVTPREGG